MATKLPYVLPFEDGSVVAAILLKAQGLPETEQIATKTELQQATAYLATLDNATMAPQSATVKRTTDNLQAQIDNIVRAPESGGDVAAEVYQARVGADGANYQTLKERLDSEYDDSLFQTETLSRASGVISGCDILTSTAKVWVSDIDFKSGCEYVISGNIPTTSGLPVVIALFDSNDVQLDYMTITAGSLSVSKTYIFPEDKQSCYLKARYTGTTSDILKLTLTVVEDANSTLISALKSSTKSILTDSSDWSIRNIWLTPGDPMSMTGSTTVISTTPIAQVANLDIMTGVTLSCNEGYLYAAGWGDADIKCISTTGWVNHVTYMKKPENAVYLCVKVKRVDGLDIAISEFDKVQVCCDNVSEIVAKEILPKFPGIAQDVTEFSQQLADLAKELGVGVETNLISSMVWLSGNVSPWGGTVESATRCYSQKFTPQAASTNIAVSFPTTMKYRITFWDSDTEGNATLINTDSNTYWQSSHGVSIEIPEGTHHYRLSAAFLSDSTIAPEDCSTIQAQETLGEIEYDGTILSILGDSISTFEGYTYPGNRCRYPQANLLTDVNDTYWMRLINTFRLKLGINESWAGSRVSWDGSTESTDIGANKYIASPTRIGHLGENGNPNIIIINAGTNDIGNNVTVGTFNTENPANYTDAQIAALPVATFADAYRALLIRVQKAYPESKILVLLPNYTSTYYTPTKADEYCEVIKEACDYFGVKWIDMRNSGITMFNRASYLPDGIHYNARGMRVIAKDVEKFMRYNFTITL